MIYAMSDIHGCYKKYCEMLKKINFSDEDTLYILGDVVDRGEQGLKVLLDLAKRENVVLLTGNHDYLAVRLLSNLHLLEGEQCSEEIVETFGLWLTDGGDKTLSEYLLLSEEERKTVLKMLKSALFSKEIEVNGIVYLLAHTVPEVDRISEYETWGVEEYTWGEPDYEEEYFKDKYIVTGHTPTGFIETQSAGKIWKGNRHIAIDCGAVFGNPLGCICLNNLEEFYVEEADLLCKNQ